MNCKIIHDKIRTELFNFDKIHALLDIKIAQKSHNNHTVCI